MTLELALQILSVSFALGAAYLIIKCICRWREAKRWALYITFVPGQQPRRVEEISLVRDILRKTKGKPGVYLTEKRFFSKCGRVWEFELLDANIKDTWIPGGYDKIVLNDGRVIYMETYVKSERLKL